MRFVLLILVLVSSCKGQKSMAEAKEDENIYGLVELVQDGYFPVDTPENMIIEDTKTLNSFFSKINKTRKPGIPVPVVDFSNEMVLVACSGAVKGEVFPKIVVDRETETSLVLKAMINENKASDTLITYPFCIYKMPKTDKEVIFELP